MHITGRIRAHIYMSLSLTSGAIQAYVPTAVVCRVV